MKTWKLMKTMPSQKTSVFVEKMLPSEDVPPFGVWRPRSFGDRCVDVVDELWLPRAPEIPSDILDSWGSKWSSSAYKNILYTRQKKCIKEKANKEKETIWTNSDISWYFHQPELRALFQWPAGLNDGRIHLLLNYYHGVRLFNGPAWRLCSSGLDAPVTSALARIVEEE